MRLYVWLSIIGIFTASCTNVHNSTTVESTAHHSVYEAVVNEIITEIHTEAVKGIILNNQVYDSVETYENSWNNPLLQNDLSVSLRTMQNTIPGILEVFATDKHGNNIAQTNVTSDLFQADEEWWQTTYANGKGQHWFGEIEYDESVGANCIPLYISITNESGEVIVILKALMHAAALEHRIWQYTHETL